MARTRAVLSSAQVEGVRGFGDYKGRGQRSYQQTHRLLCKQKWILGLLPTTNNKQCWLKPKLGTALKMKKCHISCLCSKGLPAPCTTFPHSHFPSYWFTSGLIHWGLAKTLRPVTSQQHPWGVRRKVSHFLSRVWLVSLSIHRCNKKFLH